MEKDATITELLAWLEERLGRAFTVTDHWESDLCAIGISAPNDPAQLVYISIYGQPRGRYAIALESATLPGSEPRFQDDGKFDSVDREELLRIMTEHPGISQ
jgi:hypothetical protein